MTISGDQMRSRMRRAGGFSFWFQAVIGVLSGIFWLIALLGQLATGTPSFGSQLAPWVTLFSLLILAGNCILTFRYWRSRESRNLKTVLYIGIIGAFLAVISSAAQIGDLLASLFLFQTLVSRQEGWGLLLATVNTNVTLAHLISLTAILWIYGILGKSSS